MDQRKIPRPLPMNLLLAALPPYNAGMTLARAGELGGLADIAWLASNENPVGCSPAVRAALASAAFEPWRYADPACTGLRAALRDEAWVRASVARLRVERDRVTRALREVTG